MEWLSAFDAGSSRGPGSSTPSQRPAPAHRSGAQEPQFIRHCAGEGRRRAAAASQGPRLLDTRRTAVEHRPNYRPAGHVGGVNAKALQNMRGSRNGQSRLQRRSCYEKTQGPRRLWMTGVSPLELDGGEGCLGDPARRRRSPQREQRGRASAWFWRCATATMGNSSRLRRGLGGAVLGLGGLAGSDRWVAVRVASVALTMLPAMGRWPKRVVEQRRRGRRHERLSTSRLAREEGGGQRHGHVEGPRGEAVS